MQKEIIEIEAKLGDAIEEIKKLNKLIDNLQNTSKDTSKSVDGIGKSVKGVGTALKTIGIGVVIALFTKLQEVFLSNQKVADAFATVAETISLVFNELVNTTIEVYEAVSKSTDGFDALGKVLGGLLKLAITPLKLGFYGIKLGIQEAQLIWEKSFFGGKDKETIAQLTIDILETKNALLVTGEEAIQAGKDIVSNIGEAITEVAELTTATIESVSKISIKNAYESAQSIVQLKKSAEIAAALQQGLVEENDRLAEKQRQIRDDDSKSIAERIKANNKLLKVLEKQREDMRKQADLQTAAAQADYNKNQSTENYIALLDAQNNEKAIEAQIEGFLSEQIVNKIALQKESNDLTNSELETRAEIQSKQREFDAEQEQNELRKLELQQENLLKQAEIDLAELERKRELYALDTQARVDAENEYLLQKQEIDNAITENAKAQDEEKKKSAIALEDAKLAIAQNGLSILGSLAKKGSAVAKGVAVAQAIISTYQGVNKALAETTDPTPTQSLRFANAAAVGIAGLLNVKKILSTNESGASVGGGAGGGANVQKPQFNVVGNTGINQLTESINNKEDTPVKAFVVSKDVTSQQEMDRNVVNSATFG